MALKKRPPVLAVSESRGQRYLHIGGDAIQSAMRVANPDALALDYTRCMMGFLLFHSVPLEVMLIGLGGGSLVKFFYRQLPAARLRVVEYDRRVAVAARDHFHLPPEGPRLRVEIGDGARALAAQSCDTLVVDGFDDDDQVAGLASSDFYDSAYLALKDRGVMVVNYLADDRLLDQYLVRLEHSFAGAVICLPALTDPNVIAFAFKGVAAKISWKVLRMRARRLEGAFGLPFPRYVERLKKMNRWDKGGVWLSTDT